MTYLAVAGTEIRKIKERAGYKNKIRCWSFITQYKGGGRIQNDLTKILNPPLRAK